MSDIAQIPDESAQIGCLIFAMLTLDPKRCIASANPAAEALLGASEKRLVGKRLVDLLKLDDERTANQLDVPEVSWIARGVWIESAGVKRRVNITQSPITSYPGWSNVTLSELGHGDKGDADDGPSQSSAPSILAHEIKNPLAAIRGAGQLLARKVAPSERPMARMIVGEVDRIADVIDRMQQLSSNHDLPIEACNPHEIIRNAVATVRAGQEKPIEIREEFDPSLPPVLAQKEPLEQVLINLISNACDACSFHDEAEVVLRTRFVSGFVFKAIRLGTATRLPIEIAVIDNGAGIDPTLRDHVFEPFVTSKSSGQGLGLALARKLITDMHGRIGHSRDEKTGLTSFNIHLPMAEPAKKAAS